MERDRRGGAQVGVAIVVAAAIGFLIALLVFGNDDEGTNVSATVETTATTGTTGATGPATTTQNGTTTTVTVTTPTQGAPSVGDCINLWNRETNKSAQTFLADIVANQAVRVNVGRTAQVPPECLITVIANDGNVYSFAEGGGATFPYNPTPARTKLEDIPPPQREQNALEQPGGTLQPKP